MKRSDPDVSNGYEAVAKEFAAARGRSDIGAETIRRWLRTLEPGSDILELGCGDGIPISQTLIDGGANVYGVDASPTLVTAFRKNFPNAHVVCESVEASNFFGRSFDAVAAIGLFFLLPENTQKDLIRRVAEVLDRGGRFLFTSPAQAVTWTDILTEKASVSLGAATYKAILADAGFALAAEYDDKGGNHYYDAVRS
jgi:SAM-dependent methyltransferase